MEKIDRFKLVFDYLRYKVGEYNSSIDNIKDKVLSTTKRLNIYIYLFDVLYMQENNGKSFFNEEFYAWPTIPTIPRVYYEDFDQLSDPFCEKFYKKLDNIALPSEEIKDLIDYIIKSTYYVDTADLVEMVTLDDSPWKKICDENNPSIICKGRCIIPKEDIYQYYRDRNVFEYLITLVQENKQIALTKVKKK